MISDERLYEWDYIQALQALEKGDCHSVECDSNEILDGYDKYRDFYLCFDKKSLVWKSKKDNSCRTAFHINYQSRALKFRPYG